MTGNERQRKRGRERRREGGREGLGRQMYRKKEWPDAKRGKNRIRQAEKWVGVWLTGWTRRKQSGRSNSGSIHKLTDVKMSHIIDSPVLISVLACSSTVC